MPAMPPRRHLPLVLVVAALVVVAAVVAVLATAGGDGDGDAAPDESPAADPGDSEGSDGAAAGDGATAPVTVEGEALPALPDGGDDPAVGRPMPRLSGTGVDGAPVTVGDGPGVVVFLAHWCPHCQAEVPVLQDWVDGGGLPDGTTVTAVATGTDPDAPNYPPGEWLEGEGWTAPTLLDSEEFEAARAAGLTAYPFFVFVDADGRVAERRSGELESEEIESTLRDLVANA